MNFTKFAATIAEWMGKPVLFGLNVGMLFLWLILGPVFKWSSGFMLVGNSVMSAVAYLAVFILQHTQNRDSEALHKKLDGIIDALEDADNNLKGIEKDIEESKHC